MKQTIESFIPYPLINVITVSKLDGRQIGDLKPELYEKVTLLLIRKLYFCILLLFLPMSLFFKFSFFSGPHKNQGEPRSCTGFAEPQESLYEDCYAFIHVLDDVAHLALVENSEDLAAVFFA